MISFKERMCILKIVWAMEGKSQANRVWDKILTNEK